MTFLSFFKLLKMAVGIDGEPGLLPGINETATFSPLESRPWRFAKYKFLNSDIYSIWNIGKSNKLEKKLDKILKSIKKDN